MLTHCTKYEELDLVKNENVLLKQTLENFKIGSKSLNMILGNKSHVYRKVGIGYVSSNTQ